MYPNEPKIVDEEGFRLCNFEVNHSLFQFYLCLGFHMKTGVFVAVHIFSIFAAMISDVSFDSPETTKNHTSACQNFQGATKQ